MPRVWALAAAVAAVFAAAACTVRPAPQPQPAPTAAPTTSAPAVALATPPASPGDPAVTKQVCVTATAAAVEATKVFTDQIALLEAAAAKDDRTAMVAAAEAIQKELVELAASLATLSQQQVSPAVRSALTDGYAVLKEISSESYPGTAADIQKRLSDLAAGFAKTCA